MKNKNKIENKIENNIIFNDTMFYKNRYTSFIYIIKINLRSEIFRMELSERDFEYNKKANDYILADDKETVKFFKSINEIISYLELNTFITLSDRIKIKDELKNLFGSKYEKSLKEKIEIFSKKIASKKCQKTLEEVIKWK